MYLMTDYKMQKLRKMNLYHISGDNIACPNYRYCKKDAPYYEQLGNGDWLRIGTLAEAREIAGVTE